MPDVNPIADWMATTSDEKLIRDNMVAIDNYIVTTKAQTSKATSLQDDWKKWYDGISWYQLHVDPGTKELYAQARNRRIDFDKANAVSEAEKNAVAEVQSGGLTSEEMTGGSSRKLSTGKYEVKKPPLIPVWAYWTGGALVIGSVLIFSYGLAGAIPAAILAKLGAHQRKEGTI